MGTNPWELPSLAQEIDPRFAPLIEQMVARPDLRLGQAVLDLGAGISTAAFAAAEQVGANGPITAAIERKRGHSTSGQR